jgi:hypothetical protein
MKLMKTTILPVTKSDDLYSIQDKLTWNKSGRVLLKLEGDNTLFLSRKELALLVRFAKNLGSQLGVISESRAIRITAQRYGIPVFNSLREAQQKGWQQTKQNPLTKDEQRRVAHLSTISKFIRPLHKEPPFLVRIFIFLIAVCAVISLVVFFIPSVSIEIQTEQTTQSLEVPVKAKPSITEIDMAGTLPIQIHQLEQTLDDQIDCTGSVDVAVSKAAGDLLIQNLTENELNIQAGTIFSSSKAPDLRFTSLEDAVLPAGINETIRISVEAVLRGKESNLPANQIDAVEGDLGLFISVSNPETLSGGENLSSRSPTQADLTKLHTRMTSSLLTQANSAFVAESTDGEIYIPGSARLVEILDESTDPQIGQPSEVLRVSQQAKFEGWFIRKADLEQVLMSMLDIQLPENEQALDSGLNYKATQRPIIRDDLVEWQFQVDRTILQKVNINEIRRNLVGKGTDEIGDILAGQGLKEGQVTIHVFPSWWKQVPFLESRIEVSLNE